MRTHYHETYTSDGETKIVIEYTRTPFIPAKTYGPPEDCYPAEGGETEIVGISMIVDGEEVPYLASDAEIEAFYKELDSLPIEDDDGPDADYWYDLRRDEKMMGYE